MDKVDYGYFYRDDGVLYISGKNVDPDDTYIEEIATGAGKIINAVGVIQFPVSMILEYHLNSAELSLKECTTIAGVHSDWTLITYYTRKRLCMDMRNPMKHDEIMTLRMQSLKFLGISDKTLMGLFKCSCCTIDELFDRSEYSYNPKLVNPEGPSAEELDIVADSLACVLTTLEMSSLVGTICAIRQAGYGGGV